MGDSRLSARFGADTTDFKNGLNAIQREIKILESGFQANAASLGDWSKSATGLELKIEALTGKMGLQREKVDALTVEYEQLAAAKGKESVEAQNALIKLQNETATLGAMQFELGETRQKLDEMGKEAGETGKEVEGLGKKEEGATSAADRLKAAAGGLGAALKVMAGGVASLAAGVAGLGVGIGKMVLDTAKFADGLDEMSLKTGISAERLQELNYVAGQVGTDTETVTGSLAKLTRSMEAAQSETEKAAGVLENVELGETAKRFKMLGVNVQNASGELRDANVVYRETVTALNKIEDPTARNAAALEIFGKMANQVSLKDLPGLIRKMGEAVEQRDDYSNARANARNVSGPMAEAFQKMGVSVTDAGGKLRTSEAVFNDVIAALSEMPDGAERDALAMQIFGKSAMELNPLIKAGAGEIARLSAEAHKMGAVLSEEDVTAAANFSDQLASLQAGLKGTVMQISTAFLPGLSAMAAKGGGYLKSFASIVKSAGGDLSKLTTGVAGLMQQIVTDIAAQAPALLAGGLAIVQGITTAIVQSIPALLPAVVGMLTTLIQFIVQNIPLLLQAAVQILVGLATGLTEALPQLIPAVGLIISQMVATLLDNLPQLIEAAILLMAGLVIGLVNALPKLFETAGMIIAWLVNGIVEGVPKLVQAAGDLIQTWVDAIAALGSKLLGAGKSIIDGVWNGIQSGADFFRKQVEGFFKGIVDGIKAILGIKSPSTVFAGIGENMAAGMGVGFAEQFERVEKQINRAVEGMEVSGAVNVGLNGGGGGPGGGNRTVNLGGIRITVNGGGEARVVRQAVEQGVLRALRATGGA